MSDSLIVDTLTAARIMLADCPAWQALKSSWTDRDTALAGVHLIAAAVPSAGLASLRPFALVQMPPSSLRLQLSGAGPQMSHTSRGMVDIEIETNVTAQEGDTAADPALRFYRTLSGLLLELADRSNIAIASTGTLRLLSVAVVEGPLRTAEDDVEEIGDAFMAKIRLEWGLR